MKKVCVIVREDDRSDALEKLRDFGVIHIERSAAASTGVTKALERKSHAEEAIALIQPYKSADKKSAKNPDSTEGRERRIDTGPRRGRRSTDKMGIEALEPYSLDAINAPARPDLIDLMNGMGNDRKVLEEQVSLLTSERNRVAPWGEFDPAVINEFLSHNIKIFFYELTPETFALIPKDTCYLKINEDSKTIRFLTFDNEIPNLAQFKLPEKSLSQLDAELIELIKKVKTLEEKIKGFVTRRQLLAKEMAGIENDVNFELAIAEFFDMEGMPEDYRFSCLKGYVPAEDLPKIKKAAAKHHWALAAEDPGLEDDVPTKLKNHRIVGLLSPLTEFLDLVPGYHEVDVSGWFLLFFTIFFGMIFGDAAYGLILLAAALFGISKTRKTSVPLALKMLFLFAISNVVWGTLTCTWFGIDIYVLPQFFRNISLSYISTAKGTDQLVVNQNLQLFCFTLALLQLSIARIGGIIRCVRTRNPKIFANLGVLMMLWGMFNIVLFLVVSNEYRTFPVLPVSVYLLGGGFILNFIFGYYETGVGQSILDSLKNIISVVLGVTGIFSDIMSYIRLWAVGLAGASLAATINAMAGPMLGNFLIFFGIILLSFGHGLNFILNVLSVLVHGVRLNILEFSGHVGLTWSGIAYKPFTEIRK